MDVISSLAKFGSELWRVFFISSVLLSAACTGIGFESPMFYDEKKNPVYLNDIFDDATYRRLASKVVEGDLDAIESIGKRVEGLDFQGKYGITLLWLAVDSNRPEVVRYLLADGSSPNVDIIWVSSIIGAAAEKDPLILRLLLESGASVSTPSGGFDRLMPIHHASRSDFSESIAILANAGANVDSKSKSGVTPLILAASSRKLDNVISLLELGADPKATNVHGASVTDVLRNITLNESNQKKAEIVFKMVGR